MTRNQYLLTLTESSGNHEFETHHVIKADDRQMVKYHFHRTLKDWGYTDAYWSTSKHCLEFYNEGLDAEIESIVRLDALQYDVLKEHVNKWTKV